MKKQHNPLKLYRTAIALLNDPMLQGIRGGNDQMLRNAKPGYTCGGTRDTATIPAPTAPALCGRYPDTEPYPDRSKA